MTGNARAEVHTTSCRHGLVPVQVQLGQATASEEIWKALQQLAGGQVQPERVTATGAGQSTLQQVACLGSNMHHNCRQDKKGIHHLCSQRKQRSPRRDDKQKHAFKACTWQVQGWHAMHYTRSQHTQLPQAGQGRAATLYRYIRSMYHTCNQRK